MSKPNKKICPYCGKEFAPAIHNQIYCSRKCTDKAIYERNKKNKNKLDKRKCIICGDEFEPKTSTQTICGKDSCKKERAKQRMDKFLKNGYKEKRKGTCIICGEEFETNQDSQKICSNQKCRKELSSRQKRGIPESEYKKMIGQYTYHENTYFKQCEVCGKSFFTQSWNQKYCSKECKLINVRLGRENNLLKERICEECGSAFMPTSSSQKYCKDCVEIIKKRKQKQYNDNKPRKDYEPIPCLYCGELFKPKKSSEKYCCKEHQESHYKESGYNKKVSHEHYINNIERYHEQRKKYYEEHKEETRERARKNRLKPKSADTLLKDNIRQQVYSQVKNSKNTKDFHTFELLGYTSKDLKERLESLFEQNSKEGRPKLSWQNMGEIWHIDHIKPQASFKFVNEDGSLNQDAIKECWKLDNLQPLYAEDNVHKSSYDENGVFWKQGEPISYNPNMNKTEN